MKTCRLALVTALVTIASLSAQDQSWLQMWDAAQKLKPAHLNSTGRVAPATEPGTPLAVHGGVFLPTGEPVAGVEIFAYQTDRTGLYASKGAADPWRLKGWVVSDPQGRFELATIRPGSYPAEAVPAHIHLTLVTKCCGRQSAELMFEDDPLVTKEYRGRDRPLDIKLYGKVERRTDGSQETRYTITLRPKGDF